MFSRKGQYSEPNEESTLDSLSRKLATDLRTNIRKLASHPILSKDWMEMAESLQRIASIAIMEQKLPKKGDEGTLWEREELTVRFLLEEGKLNMCLRLLNDFKLAFRNSATKRSLIQKASEELNLKPEEVEAKVDAFEQNMGVLIHCALKSVESLQTVDIPLLIKHSGEVLAIVAEDPEIMNGKTGLALERCQETLVLQYLLSLGRKLESLSSEDRAMELLEEYGVLTALVAFIHRHYALYKGMGDILPNLAEFLALVFDTEHFQTHRDRIFSNDTQRMQACDLRAAFIDDMLVDVQARKKLQPLLDTLNVFKRKLAVNS
mmetsp:Transcript_25125/g.43370  ORF Transcript_25125/g.43370 Transcript_25125/m.43370 type:complete len:320 (+) Transcript_25125:88-1047(+)